MRASGSGAPGPCNTSGNKTNGTGVILRPWDPNNLAFYPHITEAVVA